MKTQPIAETEPVVLSVKDWIRRPNGEPVERRTEFVSKAAHEVTVKMLVDALENLMGYTTALRARLAAAGGILEATSSEMSIATEALKKAQP